MDVTLKELQAGFDVIAYLSNKGITFTKPGKNVSSGHIGIRCPFCDDSSNHFGISMERKTINCFRCGTSGTVFDLVMQIEDVGFGQSVGVIKNYQTDEIVWSEEEKEEKKKVNHVLPFPFRPMVVNIPDLVVEWFDRRRFPISLIRKYKFGWVGYGEFSNRMIAPVFLDNMIVSFLVIDVRENPGIKYKDCKPERAIIQNKHLLYGVDWVPGKELIIVEGITDKMRVGDKAIALLTKNFTRFQLDFLRRRFSRDTEITVALDADASDQGLLLAKQLQENFSTVIHAELQGNDDPDTLENTDLEILRKGQPIY